MADIYDRLEIRVVEAKDLLKPHSIIPSPYVEVTVGQDAMRTETVTESDKPQWNSNMMIFSSLLVNNADTIQVEVFHVDQFSGRSASLGSCFINMITFYNSPQILIDEWYPLLETNSMTEKASGMIRLHITYFNAQDPELQGDESPEGLKQPNCLSVKITSAQGISTSPVEAFVVVEVEGHKDESKVCYARSFPISSPFGYFLVYSCQNECLIPRGTKLSTFLSAMAARWWPLLLKVPLYWGQFFMHYCDHWLWWWFVT